MDFQKMLEKDVPECYYSMALIQAAIDYYMLYEAWSGEPEEGDARSNSLDRLPVAKKLILEITDLVECFYGSDYSKAAEYHDRVFKLREEIKTAAMEVASYTDTLRIYEYVINRAKPVDRTELKPFNNDAAARDVLSAIFSSGENAAINENIKLAVSQLPLRMTKVRFFDVLEDSLRKYIDTDSSSLDREIYMIRSSAGMYVRNADRFPELEEYVHYFESLEYQDMSPEKYAEAEGRLREAVMILTDLSEALQSGVTVVNLLGVISLMYPYAESGHERDVLGMTVITDEAVKGLRQGKRAEMSEETLAGMQKMEGSFEPILEKLQRLQTKINGAYKDNAGRKEAEMVKKLDICERLISPSAFADLEDEASTVLTEDMVLKKYAALKDELTARLSSDTRMISRARMAAVLAQLPVFFESRTEVMNYVRDSLDGCRDIYEKMVSVKLLLDTINHSEG